MKTAWNDFVAWRNTRRAEKDALAESAAATEQRIKQEANIKGLMRRFGPISHGYHVYSLRNDEIECEPLIDSRSLLSNESA